MRVSISQNVTDNKHSGNIKCEPVFSLQDFARPLHHCSYAPYGLFVLKREAVYLIMCFMENVCEKARSDDMQPQKSDDTDIANKRRTQELWEAKSQPYNYTVTNFVLIMLLMKRENSYPQKDKF